MEFLQLQFPVSVVSAFPFPFGIRLFEFQNPVQRACLLDASPIETDFGVLRVRKHDEVGNLRACPYTRENWIMFLGFLLDYQTPDFIKATMAPFGRLLRWYEGPNKLRVLVQCLIISPDRVPRSVVISQDTLLGETGHSWAVPTYILDGQFPDVFPPDEDPILADGNPHPLHGAVNQVNPNIIQGWQHDLAGAPLAVQADMGIDAQAMADIQNELAAQAAENIVNNDNWEQWDNQADEMDEQQADNEDVIMEEVQQQEIAFDQSGSTAEYLRAHGPDITLNVEDVLAGNYSNSSSSSTDEVVSAMPSSQGSLPQFIQVLECQAFQKLATSSIP